MRLILQLRSLQGRWCLKRCIVEREFQLTDKSFYFSSPTRSLEVLKHRGFCERDTRPVQFHLLVLFWTNCIRMRARLACGVSSSTLNLDSFFNFYVETKSIASIRWRYELLLGLAASCRRFRRNLPISRCS